MKNVIFISTLLAAGTLAANAATEPTGTYEDEKGNKQYFNFSGGGSDPYRLDLFSGKYKKVEINSNPSINSVIVVIESDVTFDGFTFNGVSKGGSDFYGEPNSVLGGDIVLSNISTSYIFSRLSSGTHFSIDSNSVVAFRPNIWDIKNTMNLSTSLIEGAGTIGMTSTDTFTLNFLSEEVLKKTQTISLVSAETQLYEGYSRFGDIAITVDGKAVSNYTATQINGGRDISIKFVPEPSMFGLLAGTLALALAGTRRRRK